MTKKQYVNGAAKQAQNGTGNARPHTAGNGGTPRGSTSDLCSVGKCPKKAGKARNVGPSGKIGRELVRLIKKPYLRGGVKCINRDSGGFDIFVSVSAWNGLHKQAAAAGISNPLEWVFNVVVRGEMEVAP